MNTNNKNKNIKKKYEGGNIEHEYQFPDINKKEIIKKMKRLGGKRKHRKALYTSVYYWNYEENYFYRIRKEYNNITLTKKVLRESKMPLEYEINILSGSTFEEIENFLNNIMDLSKCGKIEVEKFREKWQIDGLCNEIVFDIWPGLPEYMEIDCGTKRELDEIITKLGLKGKKYYTKGVFDYYQDVYGLKDRTVLKNSTLKFATFKNTLGVHITENKEYLSKMQKLQRKLVKK